MSPAIQTKEHQTALARGVSIPGLADIPAAPAQARCVKSVSVSFREGFPKGLGSRGNGPIGTGQGWLGPRRRRLPGLEGQRADQPASERLDLDLESGCKHREVGFPSGTRSPGLSRKPVGDEMGSECLNCESHVPLLATGKHGIGGEELAAAGPGRAHDCRANLTRSATSAVRGKSVECPVFFSESDKQNVRTLRAFANGSPDRKLAIRREPAFTTLHREFRCPPYPALAILRLPRQSE